MKISLFPHNKPGAWSSLLSVSFIALIWLKIQYAIHLPTPFIAALGLAGFFAGIVAIVIKKDRSLLTFLSVPVGVLILVWIAGEIVFSQ